MRMRSKSFSSVSIAVLFRFKYSLPAVHDRIAEDLGWVVAGLPPVIELVDDQAFRGGGELPAAMVAVNFPDIGRQPGRNFDVPVPLGGMGENLLPP